MTDKAQRPKGRDGVLSSLNAAVDILNIAKEVSSVAPANVAFSSTSDLLTLIRVRLLPTRVSRLLKDAGLGDLQSGICRARADPH